jgi:hypothetical protein
MSRDVYGEARALGVAVWDAGHPSWSQRIDDDIAGGAVATEILMALHHTLGGLLELEPTLQPELRDRAAELRTAIARTLR